MWEWNPGPPAGKASPLPQSHLLSPHAFNLHLIEMVVSLTFLPGLASNHDPPYLGFPSSWDYKHEPPVPSGSTHSILEGSVLPDSITENESQ
jgi:hypothetical protein